MIIVISIIYVHVVLIFRTIMNRGFGLVLFGTDVHTSIYPLNHYGVEGGVLREPLGVPWVPWVPWASLGAPLEVPFGFFKIVCFVEAAAPRST